MAVFEEPEIVIKKNLHLNRNRKESDLSLKKKGGDNYLFHLLYPSKCLLEDRGKLIIIGYPD